ncbi:MAG TPA: outer membrane beta-barrel protein [Blastocatellia bacterium]|nr:outer membrane beta-barrel protein [Blastocatellia bacterium]
MRLRTIGAIVTLLLCVSAASAQQAELGLTVGALKTGGGNLATSSSDPTAHSGNSFALQADLSARFFTVGLASLYFDFPVAVTPKTNIITSNALSVRSYSSLYFTPGVKLKLLPLARISPYVVGGIGLARLSPSDTLVNGQPVTSDTKVNVAYSFGGGVDVKWAPHISLRGEIRDYNTVTPAFTLTLFEKRQNNALISGGVVLRF